MNPLNFIVGLAENAKTAFQVSFLTGQMFKTLLTGLIVSVLLTGCASTTNTPFHFIDTKILVKANFSILNLNTLNQ